MSDRSALQGSERADLPALTSVLTISMDIVTSHRRGAGLLARTVEDCRSSLLFCGAILDLAGRFPSGDRKTNSPPHASLLYPRVPRETILWL